MPLGQIHYSPHKTLSHLGGVTPFRLIDRVMDLLLLPLQQVLSSQNIVVRVWNPGYLGFRVMFFFIPGPGTVFHFGSNSITAGYQYFRAFISKSEGIPNEINRNPNPSPQNHLKFSWGLLIKPGPLLTPIRYSKSFKTWFRLGNGHWKNA